MRVGELGWILFLAGLPFAHFVFRPLDLWFGQAAWSQAWVLLLWLYTLQKGSGGIPRPLAWWAGWVACFTMLSWYATIRATKQYPLPLLPGALNCLFGIFFCIAASWWTEDFLRRLLRVMAWAGVVILAYCGLQLMNFDQFFRDLDLSHQGDLLVGTIGNPSHLGAQLAFLLPIVFLQRGKVWKVFGLLMSGLLCLTHSRTGIAAGLLGMLWCSWFWSRKAFLVLLGSACIGGFFLFSHLNHLNPHGRWAAWTIFWHMAHNQPITGMGTGFVMAFSETIVNEASAIFQWRHVHNEYLQVFLEQGVVGLGLLLWVVKEAWQQVYRLPKSPELVACGGVLIAFLFDSFFNFPAHLWLLMSYGLVAYCGIYTLANQHGIKEPV